MSRPRTGTPRPASSHTHSGTSISAQRKLLKQYASGHRHTTETEERRFLSTRNIVTLQKKIDSRRKEYYKKKCDTTLSAWNAAVNETKRFIDLDVKYNGTRSLSNKGGLDEFLNSQLATINLEINSLKPTLTGEAKVEVSSTNDLDLSTVAYVALEDSERPAPHVSFDISASDLAVPLDVPARTQSAAIDTPQLPATTATIDKSEKLTEEKVPSTSPSQGKVGSLLSQQLLNRPNLPSSQKEPSPPSDDEMVAQLLKDAGSPSTSNTPYLALAERKLSPITPPPSPTTSEAPSTTEESHSRPISIASALPAMLKGSNPSLLTLRLKELKEADAKKSPTAETIKEEVKEDNLSKLSPTPRAASPLSSESPVAQTVVRKNFPSSPKEEHNRAALLPTITDLKDEVPQIANKSSPKSRSFISRFFCCLPCGSKPEDKKVEKNTMKGPSHQSM